MKRWLVFGLTLFLLWSLAIPALAELPPKPAWWTGYNANLDKYYVAPGYPRYDTHARYIGELSGTWEEMGVQYGERAGDLIRLVFDGYYAEIFAAVKDDAKMLEWVRKQGEMLNIICPEAVQFMRGIAKGADMELQKTHNQVGDSFDKVLIINHYYALRKMADSPVWTPGTTISKDYVDRNETPACSGMVVIGKMGGPTADRTTIHGGTRDQHFFPQCYEVTYTTAPSDPKGRRIWTVSSAGEIGGQMAGNDKGVVVSGYAGANVGAGSAFGLEWNVGDWYAASLASTAEEAVELLTLGRPEYRAETGRKIMTPAWGINWVISDNKNAAVVEIMPGRYAVRRPGDMGEEDYIVSTNGTWATWSCDESNVRTDVPMRDFGPSDGDYAGLNGRGTRFWTLMWEIKRNYGNIDRNMVMRWYQAKYFIDEAGFRHDYWWKDGVGWIPACYATSTISNHGGRWPETYTSTTTDAKVAVSQDLAFYFTNGRGSDWVGPWDSLSLKFRP